jgi:hypothetical protein
VARDLSWEYCRWVARVMINWHERQDQFDVGNSVRICSVECFGPCAPRAQGR